VQRRRLGDLALVDCGCDPCGGRRGPQQIRATDGEWVAVLMNLAGHELIEQGERTAELLPGDAVVWESTQPARFAVLEPLHKRTLLLPRTRLAELCPRLHEATGVLLERDRAATRLFTAFVAELARTLPSLDPVARATAGNVVVELLAAALGQYAQASELALHSGLYARVCAYIEQRLWDPSLRPPAIAAAHGMSVRTLHLIFAERGESVGSHIRRLRLARCHAELSRPGPWSISDIAFHWGFSDAAHFSRAFKERYGVTPRDVRAAAHDRGPAPSERRR
jgi:AraC family transcriptional activator of tynA and feaB